MIVEDVEDTLRQLEAFISEYFAPLGAPHEIDKAMSVTEACHLLEEASVRKRPYHAVILDFNLPGQRGQPAQVDESVCSMIRTLMPATLVAHITAYQDDELVQNHLKQVHWPDLASPSVAFSKVDYEYPIRLVEHLKTFFFSKRVEEQMDKIFSLRAEESFAERRRGSTTGASGSLTHELAALCRDIEAHWPDLDERLQARLKQIFNVDHTGTQVTVRLL